MTEFLCSMPGLDGATAAWHGVLHVGLAAVIVVAGTIFLALAVLAYVRSAPAAATSGSHASVGAGEPYAAIRQG